jgi:hypothetical protein
MVSMRSCDPIKTAAVRGGHELGRVRSDREANASSSANREGPAALLVAQGVVTEGGQPAS